MKVCKFKFLVLCFVLLCPFFASAKVIQVFPGHNTLATAMSSLEHGDTVVLLDGVFTSDKTVSVNKQVTMRAENAHTTALIYDFEIVFGAEANNSKIVGLAFKGGKRLNHALQILPALRIDAAQILILNNSFSRYGIIYTNNVTVVGNTFSEPLHFYALSGTNCGYCSGYIYGERPRNGDQQSPTIIAGNQFGSLNYTVNQPFQTDKNYIYMSLQDAYIMGNVFTHELDTNETANRDFIHFDSDGDKLIVYGNRFETTVKSTATIDAGSINNFINVTANTVELVNNVFSLKSESALSTHYSEASFIKIAGNYTVANNTFYSDKTNLAQPENVSAIKIATGFGNIINNAIVGINGNVFTGDTELTNFQYNLCFDSSVQSICAQSGNNLIADPLFVNTIDFKLSGGSQAINNGSKHIQHNDIDGTRNDIGVHGGPWGFMQYDSQRIQSAKPYIYPLINQIAVTAEGKANIQIVTYPRFN